MLKTKEEIKKEIEDNIIKQINEFSRNQEKDFNQIPVDLNPIQFKMLENAVKFTINLSFEEGKKQAIEEVIKIIDEELKDYICSNIIEDKLLKIENKIIKLGSVK